MIKKIKSATLIVSMVLFVLSLTQPAFHTAANQNNDNQSLMLILMGWLGTLTGGACLCWFANPLLFLSWRYLFKKPGTAVFTSFAAAIFSSLFLFFDTIMVNEAGTYSIITEHKAGYWLWLSSILFFLTGTIVIYSLIQKSNRVNNNPLALNN